MAIGFFTDEVKYTLPHPPIHPRTLLIISNVVKKAWELINEKPPAGFSLQTADEDTITQVLIEVLETRLRKNGDIDGFNCALFGRVTREPKITNFNKEHPDKMPDIFFDLKRDHMSILSDQDGLFVECKPVDRKHSVWSCYCQKGLVRFINGDYAWAMQNAMMIAYVSAPYSFDKLSSVFNDSIKSVTLNITKQKPIDKEHYLSTHNREFLWLHNNDPACPIEIVHLWLPV